MKKLPFLITLLLLFQLTVSAQNPRKGAGAANVQELGRAVYNAFAQNQFGTLQNYLPGPTELKILKRRSSEDMRLVLEKTSSDTIKENLQRDFNTILEQTTQKNLNWQEWQPAETKASRRDRKNPLLYRVEMQLANATGEHQTILIEAIRIRGRYFMFNQMLLQAKQ